MTKCSCIDKNTKKEIESSNMGTPVKNTFLSIRTCGDVSKFEAERMIRDCGGVIGSAPLKCVISKLKGAGLDREELTDLLLSMREEGAVDLEVGTPIGVYDKKELEDYTIETEKNRFAHVRILRNWANKYMDLRT